MRLKFTALLFLVLGVIFNGQAQPPTYDDLLIYYADAEYEKLLQKAEKYTLKDDTKKDPLPYLYLAKANYEISKDATFAEDYPKASKDAIKYASKCLKYDAEGEVYADEYEFFKELKTGILEELKNLIALGTYNKMISPCGQLLKLDENDIGGYFLKAAVFYNLKDKGSAKLEAEKAFELLDAVESVESWHPVDLESLKIGVIEYCKSIIAMNQVDKAKDLLGRVKQWLEHDSEFMAYYDSVIN